ncbi:hypothetical protein ACFY0P_36900 [Streptomyces sp. NPDC001714]|uniref:hypothetical protein n=1 Tax=Streptomyces sp. NPDC001714 TaxID=3364603 RepID=UPI003678D377
MRNRAADVLAPLTLASGISGVLLGLVRKNQRLTWAGSAVVTIGAVAAVHHTVKTQQATNARLAAAEVKGYRQALRDVGAGLFNDGNREACTKDNVIHMRPPNDGGAERERKAQ